MKRSVQWLARTAVALALLVAVQAVTKAGGQLVTGSCVNLLLAVCAGVLGFGSGAVVAIVSPFLAYLLGIAQSPILVVPGIALGNLVYVALIAVLAKVLRPRLPKVHMFPAVVAAALAKFAVLYLVVVKWIVPTLGVPAEKAAALSATFSTPQLVTALTGGVVAAVIVPLIRKAVRRPA